MNPHVLSDTRSLVLPVCQFQHSRATRCILAQRKPVGNNFFHFPFLLRSFFVSRGSEGVRPLGHSLIILWFCGRLRVLRGELCLTGLDILLNGLLRAFVDGTALLTAEGLHQAHVVGV